MLESDDELNDLRKGAEHGNAESQYLLAVFYHLGEVDKKDSEAAIKWYTRAAEQNHLKAQYNLAMMYFVGDDVLRTIRFTKKKPLASRIPVRTSWILPLATARKERKIGWMTKSRRSRPSTRFKTGRARKAPLHTAATMTSSSKNKEKRQWHINQKQPKREQQARLAVKL